MDINQAYAQLSIIQDFIPVQNSNRPGDRLVPTSITIHNTDNVSRGADAAAHARYQKGADARERKVSWHYTVDDKAVYQSLPTNEVGWHAKNANGTSIGIEICMHPEMHTAAGYAKAAQLVAVVAYQHDIPVPSGIVTHKSWTGKHCPRVLLDRPNGWNEFLSQITAFYNGLENAPGPAIAMVHRDG